MSPSPRFSPLAAAALIALAAAGEARAETPSRTNFSNQWQTQSVGDQQKKPQRPRAQGQPAQGTWFGQPQVRQGQPPSPWYANGAPGQPRRPATFFGLFGGVPAGQQAVDPSRQASQDEIDAAPVVEEVEGAEIYDYKPPALVPLTGPKLAMPQGLAPDDVAALAIWRRLKEGSTGMQVTAPQRDAIVAFYAERNFRPLWSGSEASTQAGERLEALFAAAAVEGLDPRDYRVAPAGGDPDPAARRDIQLTAAALRYAQHASGGRIVPNRLSGYHDRKTPAVDASRALQRLASGEPDRYLASLHPRHPAYAAMRGELKKELAAAPEVLPDIADGLKIHVGSDDERVPLIRARLAALVKEGALDVAGYASLTEGAEAEPLAGEGEISGVLAVDPGPQGKPTLFTAADAAAMRAFQRSAGLADDGVVGAATVAKLNETGRDRREQLVANMERLRWLPRDLGDKHVFVNQAAFEARVFENGQEIWRTAVIVGKPNTQTFEFSDVMETVEFNPFWGVPPSILNNEMLPKSQRDPSWLDRNGYEVVDSRGRVVSSSSVNWSAYGRNPPFGVRQPPGPENALGEVKFLFPNTHHIYMHDTPAKSLFEKDMRAFSHGCVRVENPRRFAEVILGWDSEKVAAAIASGRNQGVKVKTPTQVHLTYFTAWPDETGRIRYFADVYGRDRLVAEAMGKTELALR
jgi:murein L,D-transpeptidase YcbB/YkuD